MKPTCKIGLWKTIAFLTVVISVFSCCSDDDPNMPVVTMLPAENVTNNSATLVAKVIPNLNPTTVVFYYAISKDWKRARVDEDFSGGLNIVVTYDVKDLKPATLYKVKCVVTNAAGVSTSKIMEFTTAVCARPVAIIQPAINVTKTSATVVAKVLPNEDGTKATFEIKAGGQSTWSSYALPLTYNGKDTIKVTFDLFDLKVGTAYDFRIKAVNKAGETFSEISNFETYAVSDFDGNLYHTVKIGTQVWLKENFKGLHFANGDPIPNITGQTEWEAATSPAYCYYDNDSKYAATYGALYNWYVGVDPRGLISGFHTPSYDEWQLITNYLGGAMTAGETMKAASPIWNGTNSSGFTALPSGCRQSIEFNGVGFIGINESTALWSSTNFFGMSGVACSVSFRASSSKIQHAGNYNYFGQGLRLIKN